MQNGGAYGNGTTESGVGFESAAAGTAGKPGEFTITSCGAGQTSQDYFAECFRKDEYADCAPDGTDQRDGGQVAAAISEARCAWVA